MGEANRQEKKKNSRLLSKHNSNYKSSDAKSEESEMPLNWNFYVSWLLNEKN